MALEIVKVGTTTVYLIGDAVTCPVLDRCTVSGIFDDCTASLVGLETTHLFTSCVSLVY